MGFDPVTLGAIAIGGNLIGGGISAFGNYSAGQATKQADFYQAQVARNNAAIEEQNAQWSTESGEAASEKQAMDTRAKAGAIRTEFAAGGVDPNSGSAGKVQQAQAMLGELDAMTLRSDTARKVYGYKVAETSDLATANLKMAEGEEAEKAGDIAAVGSLLGGATSAAGFGAKMKLG
jgi:hypothetical protein